MAIDRRGRDDMLLSGARSLILLALVSLAACGAPELAATQAGTLVPSSQAATVVLPRPTAVPMAPTAIQNASQAPATAAPAASGDWPTYRADQAGFAVAYPPGWAIQEQSESGASVTTFAPSSGGAGISVRVQATDTELAEPLGRPNNRRCTQVVVGGIAGQRCLDTFTLRVPAPPGGQARSYIIASTGATIDQALYQRFLDSFALIQ